MTNADKLKEYIITKYGTVRAFTTKHDIHYTTLDSVLKRGIENSSVSTIVKICTALNISLEALINNEIKPCIIPLQNNHNIVLEIQEALSRKYEITVEIAEALSSKFTLSSGDKLNSFEIKNIIKIIDSSLSHNI